MQQRVDQGVVVEIINFAVEEEVRDTKDGGQSGATQSLVINGRIYGISGQERDDNGS